MNWAGKTGLYLGEKIQVICTDTDKRLLLKFEDGYEVWVHKEDPELLIFSKQIKAAREESAFERDYGSKKRVAFVASLGCAICGRIPAENAHVTSRGAGGTYKDIAPLCHEHHREQHRVGIESFQKKYGVDLKVAADETELLAQLDLY